MPHTILDCDGTQVNLHYIDGELPDEQYPFALMWPNNEHFASEMVEVASGCIIQRVKKIKRL